MAIYENINCPLRIGDVVRSRKYKGDGVDSDSWRCHHPDIPSIPMVVTEINPWRGGIKDWAMDIDVRCLPYWVRIVDFRTGRPILGSATGAGMIWVGFLELDPFLSAVARANA